MKFAALIVLAVIATAGVGTPVASSFAATSPSGQIQEASVTQTSTAAGEGTHLNILTSLYKSDGSHPSPPSEIDIHLPLGMELHPAGFPTCTRLALEMDVCPANAFIGTGTAVVDARPVVGTPVSARLDAATSPNGTLLLRIRPDLGQMHVIETTPITTPTGTLLAFSVPPAPVPGGPNAATTKLTLDLGKTTTTPAGQGVSYLVNPPDCPPSGWLYRFDFSYENGEQLSVADTVNCEAPPPLPPQFPVKGAAGGGGDKVAPFATLSFAPLQRVAKLFVTARASEAGTIGASASVSVGGSSKVYRFKKVSRQAVANKAVKLRLKLARTSLRKVKRALKRHKRLKANVTVTARDAAGNARSQKATIRLRA